MKLLKVKNPTIEITNRYRSMEYKLHFFGKNDYRNHARLYRRGTW